MDVRNFLFQIILFLLGLVISIFASVAAKETQKKIALSLGVILLFVSIAWVGYELTYHSYSREDVNSVLGTNNWSCFPDRLDGVAFFDVPDNFVVQYPLSNVDKENTKYILGEVVPPGGSATAWLQGALSSRQECP